MVLLTGASGALGHAFLPWLEKSDLDFETPSHQEFDITDFAACERYIEGRQVDILLHAAAIADWTQCQRNPVEAAEVNTLGAINMARLASSHRARLVMISTDAVFPGHFLEGGYKESDEVGSPTSVYGITKLVGEWCAAQISDPNYLVTRIGWMFGPTPDQDKKFVGAILRQIAQENRHLRAVNDKTGSPTYATQAAEKILHLITQDSRGIRHIANTGEATRYDLACKIVELWCPESSVESVSSEAFPSDVVNPDYSVLVSEYEEVRLPTWQEALGEYHDLYPKADSFLQAVKR